MFIVSVGSVSLGRVIVNELDTTTRIDF